MYTNADHIRNMSNTELAELLCSKVDCQACPATTHCWIGHNGMIDWLSEEFEENKKKLKKILTFKAK